MGNSDIDVNGVFRPYNASNEEKEEYIEELATAVRKYVKTGTKTRQLEDLESIQKKFRKSYMEKQFLNAALNKIQADSIQKLINDQYSEIEYLQENNVDSKIEGYLKKIFKKFSSVFRENIIDKLSDILDEVVYFGHINMLFEIYEQEQKFRRKEIEYENLLDEYGDSLRKIVNIIGQSRRIDLDSLRQKFEQEIKVEIIIIKEPQLFNIREQQGKIKVSLSPEGKKFNEYALDAKERYSYQMVKQISKKNCEAIIESMQKSCRCGWVYDIKLEKMEEWDARIIQKKYSDTMQDLLDERIDSYYYARPMEHIEKRREFDGGYKIYGLENSESINR